MNATAVWRRVLELSGRSPTEVSAPVVTVRPPSQQAFSQTELDGDTDAFGHLIGLNDSEIAEVQDSVTGARFGTVREGSAEYVADVYARRYLEGVEPSAERRAAYERARPNAWKLSRAEFYYGYRHVAARIDSPRNLSVVYEAPPETDEQLVYGLAPGEEPPVPLPVRTGAGWQRRGTVGQLPLQVALTENMTESRAARAAGGWGNDTLLRRGDAYVWTLRMDDAANASELETALGAHVEALAAADDPIDRPANVSYRVARVDEETVALVVGDPAFVETVGVSVEDGTLDVSVRNPRDSASMSRSKRD